MMTATLERSVEKLFLLEPHIYIIDGKVKLLIYCNSNIRIYNVFIAIHSILDMFS